MRAASFTASAACLLGPWVARRPLPGTTRGRLLVGDVGTMLAACLAGVGIAQIIAPGVKDLLDQGRLIDRIESLFEAPRQRGFPIYGCTIAGIPPLL